jgi:hypothetical protein
MTFNEKRYSQSTKESSFLNCIHADLIQALILHNHCSSPAGKKAYSGKARIPSYSDSMKFRLHKKGRSILSAPFNSGQLPFAPVK